jgi:hypothetical protein
LLLAAKGGGPERVFAASQSAAEPLIAAFALAAVGVEAALGAYWRRALARWAVRGGVGIAIATVVAALYAVGYLAVVHPSLVGIGVGQATLRAFAATDDWSSRVEGILTAAAAAALATTAVYVAHRSDRRSPDSPTTRP